MVFVTYATDDGKKLGNANIISRYVTAAWRPAWCVAVQHTFAFLPVHLAFLVDFALFYARTQTLTWIYIIVLYRKYVLYGMDVCSIAFPLDGNLI